MRKWLHSMFYIPKYGKVSEKALLSHLSVYISVTVLCLAAMGFTAYAYFSCTVSSGNNIITSAHFDADISIEGVTLTEIAGKHYTADLKADTQYVVKITSRGTAQTGFVVLQIGDAVYHTQQFGMVENVPVTQIQFMLQLDQDQQVVFVPHWGTSCYYGSVGESLDYYLLNDTLTLITVPEEETTEEPVEDNTEESTEEVTEKPTEEPTEAPTEAPTEEPTEAPTETPTEAPTEEPTEVPTETPTEEPTETPTEEQTEVPTEVSTEEPTGATTEEPTEETTVETVSVTETVATESTETEA